MNDSKLDLVVRNGTIATAADVFKCDIGVRDGRIVALADRLPTATQECDASGHWVLPGGIDSHCHIEQRSSGNIQSADDFYSGSVSAAFGGTTTIIPFAAQHRGQSLRQVVDEYHALAAPKAVIDYAFHLIISDPNEQVLGQELPALIEDGYTSFKVYMTYENLKLDDYQMLEILALARRQQAMVMVHAENDDIIRWLTQRLEQGGNIAPRYHAIAHARIGEGEATNRAICLAELMDVPMLVVHVSAIEAMDAIRDAQAKGLKIFAETCPQYLFLTADDLDREGMDGAMYCCSPPPRDSAAQAAVWQGLETGLFDVFSSDHAPYRFDETGKLAHGSEAPFRYLANGVPGIELRMPLLFSEGVQTGRISINRFVELTASKAAKLYGLAPLKGTIAVGADADFAIWDPDREVEVHTDMLHDNVGYTPYTGRVLRGWPVKVFSRGQLIVDDGVLQAQRGRGNFLPCDKSTFAVGSGTPVLEADPARNFGAQIL